MLGWSCLVCSKLSCLLLLWLLLGLSGGQVEKVFDVVSSSRLGDLRAFGHAMLEEGVTLRPDRESDSLEWESGTGESVSPNLTSSAASCYGRGTAGLL